MGIINNVTLFATELLEPTKSTHFVASILEWISGWVGGYGWTVVVFTILVSVVLSPLDVWQKMVMYRNAKIMQRMKPQMEKLQKQYGNNPERLQQEQLRLFRKEKYSVAGACLPIIATMVVFFIVWAGFNATTKFKAEQNYVDAYNAYATAADKFKEETDFSPESEAYEEGWKAAGDAAVLAEYKTESFLWVGNIFMPDNWSSIIPNEDTFRGGGLGKIDSNIGKNAVYSYSDVMSAVSNEYNTRWNGYLILPVLSIVLTYMSIFLSKKFNRQSAVDATAQNSMKFMQIVMPVLMGVFALIYSAAFTIYLVTRSIISTVVQLVFNVCVNLKNKRDEDKRLSTTFK